MNFENSGFIRERLELREFPEQSFRIYLRIVKDAKIECVCTTEGGLKIAYIIFPGATCTAPATETVWPILKKQVQK